MPNPKSRIKYSINTVRDNLKLTNVFIDVCHNKIRQNQSQENYLWSEFKLRLKAERKRMEADVQHNL